MSMKMLRLQVHWDAGEAYVALAFIDALREEIVTRYGDEIVEMLQEASADHDASQLHLPFTDLPPF